MRIYGAVRHEASSRQVIQASVLFFSDTEKHLDRIDGRDTGVRARQAAEKSISSAKLTVYPQSTPASS